MSDSHADMLRKFKDFLEQEQPSVPGGTMSATCAAQIAFWSELRPRLIENDDSRGLEVLDAMAAAVIKPEEGEQPVLSKPVVLLPPPSSQREATTLPSHPMFAPVPSAAPAKKRVPALTSPSGSAAKKLRATPKGAETPSKSTRATKATSVKPGEKTRTTPKSGSKPRARDGDLTRPKPKPKSKARARAKAEPKVSASSDSLTDSKTPVKLDFKLSPDAPEEVRLAIETIYRKAAARQQRPFQLAYPWVNENLFYDPEEFPYVYLVHWRFWNAFRAVFFEWALHAPLSDSSAQAQRRKRKLKAVRERLSFISFCIETWGYFRFLRRLEAPGNGSLMWWGGQSGRCTKEAKEYTCSPIRDLLDLYENDPEAYQAKIRHAVRPFCLDADGFESLTDMLEKTGALDPTAAEYEKRLSDKALALIAKDITTAVEVPSHWSPPITEGVWKKLVSDSRIHDLMIDLTFQLQDGSYELPTAPKFDPKEAEIEGYAPFKTASGRYSALGPVTEVDDNDITFCKPQDEVVAEMVAEAEAKSAAKDDKLLAALPTDSDGEGADADEDEEEVDEEAGSEEGGSEEDEDSA